MDYVAGITWCVYCKQNHVTREESEPSLDLDIPSDQIYFRIHDIMPGLQCLLPNDELIRYSPKNV